MAPLAAPESNSFFERTSMSKGGLCLALVLSITIALSLLEQESDKRMNHRRKRNLSRSGSRSNCLILWESCLQS